MNDILLNEIQKFGSLPADSSLNDKTFNTAGYTIAIQRAARDLTPRTLKPKTDVEGNIMDALLSSSEPNSLLNQIVAYFKKEPQSDFDSWHNTQCNSVLKVINKYYTNRDGSEVCYGKAQKVVNMTLKGCYCLEGALEENKKAYFSFSLI